MSDKGRNAPGSQAQVRSGKMEGYRSKCHCPPCPTHAQCAKDRGELTFCITKKSSCISEMRVCFCPECPVHKELGLKFVYYCIRGNEGDQEHHRPKE